MEDASAANAAAMARLKLNADGSYDWVGAQSSIPGAQPPTARTPNADALDAQARASFTPPQALAPSVQAPATAPAGSYGGATGNYGYPPPAQAAQAQAPAAATPPAASAAPSPSSLLQHSPAPAQAPAAPWNANVAAGDNLPNPLTTDYQNGWGQWFAANDPSGPGYHAPVAETSPLFGPLASAPSNLIAGEANANGATGYLGLRLPGGGYASVANNYVDSLGGSSWQPSSDPLYQTNPLLTSVRDYMAQANRGPIPGAPAPVRA